MINQMVSSPVSSDIELKTQNDDNLVFPKKR